MDSKEQLRREKAFLLDRAVHELIGVLISLRATTSRDSMGKGLNEWLYQGESENLLPAFSQYLDCMKSKFGTARQVRDFDEFYEDCYRRRMKSKRNILFARKR